MLRVNNKLWVISDTHFGHSNIVKYCQRPASHEVIMLSEWINAVGETDHILHLGDVFLGRGGSAKRWAKVMSRLPGIKFLILGNHDKASAPVYDEAGITIVPEFMYKGVAFTHRPISLEHPGPEGNAIINVHGHVHNNPYVLGHDGHLLDGIKYINVSVEAIDFRPRMLGTLWPI